MYQNYKENEKKIFKNITKVSTRKINWDIKEGCIKKKIRKEETLKKIQFKIWAVKKCTKIIKKRKKI